MVAPVNRQTSFLPATNTSLKGYTVTDRLKVTDSEGNIVNPSNRELQLMILQELRLIRTILSIGLEVEATDTDLESDL